MSTGSLNNWNKYHEHLLKKWAQLSKTYSIMHSLCATYYSTWNKRLGIPVVIIGGITASSIFSSNKESSEAWTYVNGGLALFVAALSGVSSFIGTAEKTNKHQTASFKYTKIAMDIDTMLSFARHERLQTPQEFIQEKKGDMLDIRENCPEVLSWVMNNYLQKFDKSLTDIKSKINNTLPIDTYIQPKLQITIDDEGSNSDRGVYSDGTNSTKAVPEETGEILSDFSDKFSSKIFLATQKMTRSSESDSEDQDEEREKKHTIDC
jgi:hypothetical protein